MPEFLPARPPFISHATGEVLVPTVSYNEFKVPRVFLHNCGIWEGQAQRIDPTGVRIDEHLVRVAIEITGAQYVQTNTVRIGTPREVTAQYFGEFRDGVLVFPLTDEVYTLGGEKATGFSGIAWAVTDELIVYQGSRTVNGCLTYYNELIALTDRLHRVRTTQLFEDNVYKLVTMISETNVI